MGMCCFCVSFNMKSDDSTVQLRSRKLGITMPLFVFDLSKDDLSSDSKRMIVFLEKILT